MASTTARCQPTAHFEHKTTNFDTPLLFQYLFIKKNQALRYYKKEMYMTFIHFINHRSMVVGTESMRESKGEEARTYLCQNQRGSRRRRGRPRGIRVRAKGGGAALPAKHVPDAAMVPEATSVMGCSSGPIHLRHHLRYHGAHHTLGLAHCFAKLLICINTQQGQSGYMKEHNNNVCYSNHTA